MFLSSRGVLIENIKKIYVLGHSFGDADMGYFRNLMCATEQISFNPESDLPDVLRDYLDNMSPYDEVNLNLQYAVHNRERALSTNPISYPVLEKLDEEIRSQLVEPYYLLSPDDQFRLEAAAVHRRFIEEQSERTGRKEKVLFKMLRRASRKWCMRLGGNDMSEHTGLAETIPVTYKPAEWYISYHSLEDKTRITETLRKLGCSRYTLYPTIDECIQTFRV